MATRAEQVKALLVIEQAKAHRKTVKRKVETEPPEERARRATSGHGAGGRTAKRNVREDKSAKSTFGLEDSADGKATRRSTRKGANRAKSDNNLRRRRMRTLRAPASRAAKAAPTR